MEPSQNAYVVTMMGTPEGHEFCLTHWVFNGATIGIRTTKTCKSVNDCIAEIPHGLRRLAPCTREQEIVVGTWC